jgi:DNA repair protein RecO (recombination protein O)
VPLYTADALILRTYKLGEADRIVVFLTRDRGKKRGVAKGARRPRSRFAAALEPMTEARVAYFEKERRELVGLNYAEPVRSPMALVGGPTLGPTLVGGPKGPPLQALERALEDRRDAPLGAPLLDALGYIGYFAELLDECAQEADADDRLFRLGASMLDALSAGVPVEPLARYFECWLLRLQGVYPEARGTLSGEAMAFLAASRTVTPQQVGAVPASRGVLKELEQVHRALIAMHLEKNLKSDRVLRDLRKHN